MLRTLKLALLFSEGLVATYLGLAVFHELQLPEEAPVAHEQIAEPIPEPEPRVPAAWMARCGPLAPPDLDLLVEEAAAEVNAAPLLLATIVLKESSCNPQAVGSSGEIGLTQVHPKFWLGSLKDEGIVAGQEDLFVPQNNLRASAFILARQLLRSEGSAWGAFRRYNGAGPRARRYARDAVAVHQSLVLLAQ